MCLDGSKARQDRLPDQIQQNKKAPFAEGPERIFKCLKEIMPQEYHAVNVSEEIVLVQFVGVAISQEKAPDVGASSPEMGVTSTAPGLNLPGIFPRAETAHSHIF